MPKKKDFRETLLKELPEVLNAVFEQGKAAQRLTDAQLDMQFASEEAAEAVEKFTSFLQVPEKQEIN